MARSRASIKAKVAFSVAHEQPPFTQTAVAGPTLRARQEGGESPSIDAVKSAGSHE